MMKSTAKASRFILLWLLCPVIALASFRFMLGGVELTMPGFVYHAELRPIAFYAHITLASVALALVPIQLWPGLRKKRLNLHRWLGRVYGVSIVAAGFGGFLMAIMTHSGAMAAWGFALLAVAWVGTTVYGIVLAMQHRTGAHERWMIRSAALTMAAVTLRLYLGLGGALGLDYPDIAGIIAWACWVPNIVVAEIIIRTSFKNKPALLRARALA